jgi:hypothetical protein
MKEVTVRPEARKLTKPQREQLRALLAAQFLWGLLAKARTGIDPVTWINKGGLEAEEFLECVDDGLSHPLLKRWRKRKCYANRPPPSRRERHARHFAVLATVALERVVSLDKDEARQKVAKAVAQVFDNAPSPETIRHWQRDDPPLTEGDELVLGTAIGRCKHDTNDQANAKVVIDYFIGLAYLALTPGTVLDTE